jgi:modulator of FtsH protease HflK
MSNHTPQDPQSPKNPFQGKRNGEGPPDLEALLRKLFRKMTGNKKPAWPPPTPSPTRTRTLGSLAGLVIVFIWLLSGFFIVQPAERAVILQFGQYATTLGPGPHWIPALIQKSIIVNEDKVETHSYQANMLTKDETIVSVAVSIQYQIANARDYLFNVVSPEESLQQATASALRHVIGHSTLDAVLTFGRSEIRAQVQKQLEHILSAYHNGIVITNVVMQPARAPEQVKAAFDDAINAQEDEQRLINQAQAYAMKIVPIAEGNAKRLLADAKAYKEQVVLKASGEAHRFTSLVTAYHLAPKVTRERMYLQAMEKLYSNTQKVIFDLKQSNPFVYLPLDKIMANTKDQAQMAANLDSNTVISKSNMTNATEPGQERERPLAREERI